MIKETGELAQTSGENGLRHDWKKSEVQAIYGTPLPELVYRAQTVHREFHEPDRVQTCQLISIKTGGCPGTAPTARKARTMRRMWSGRDCWTQSM